jgi:hypothetical protein
VNTPVYILFYCHGNFSGMNPQKTHFTDSNESVKWQFWRACTKKIVLDIFSLLYLKNRNRYMRLSTLLSKHLTDAANIQESNSVNYFNLCATIWKVRIFEGTPAIRSSGKKKRH